ncbi:MAG: FAD-binding oxidoreductase [Euryarchaeota archaeon]|nr:FAD-binding oxidoreductase [Euryarchaeota archaeon]
MTAPEAHPAASPAPSARPRSGPPSSSKPAPAAHFSGARWWAWGNIHTRFPPARAQRVKEFLRHELGVPPMGAGGPALDLETLRIPPGRLPTSEVQAVRALLTAGAASDEREERLLHSFGRSYVDVTTARRGHLRALTDLVVHPASVDEVELILRYAQEHDLAVVPWGGGTSVVGGVDPEAGSHRGVITLSLQRLMDPLGVDETSHLARFQCGIHGPDLEKHLNVHGMTLGHFPQSFEFSTLGGWLATRSSGQASSRYGEITERLRGATIVTPVGTYRWERGVTESSGSDPSSIFPGSEGTLGIFVEATLAVDPLPAHRSYRVALFPDWESGVDAMRELSQSPPSPAVLRLSGPQETILTLEGRAPAETAGEKVRASLESRYLGLKKLEEGSMCLAIIGYEGSDREVRHGEERRKETLKAHGGTDVGSHGGESWQKERFLLPYLRDDLIEDGWLIETLETGAAWSDVKGLESQVREALHAAARRSKFAVWVGAHLSHTSPTGSGVYFTIIAPQSPQDPVGQWLSLKEAATEALLRAGGVLSHHHGVGRMHRPWVASYRKNLGGLSLQAAKSTFDPKGILNPGKTLPEPRPPAGAASAERSSARAKTPGPSGGAPSDAPSSRSK